MLLRAPCICACIRANEFCYYACADEAACASHRGAAAVQIEAARKVFIDSHPLAKDKEQLTLAKGKGRNGQAGPGALPLLDTVLWQLIYRLAILSTPRSRLSRDDLRTLMVMRSTA